MVAEAWQLAQARVALFTQRALPLTTDVFTALAGVSPESTQERPREGTRVQEGMAGETHLQVVISPVRLDINMSPPPVAPEALMGEFAISMGEYRVELAKFARIVLAWLPHWDTPTTRVALIGRAICPTPSAEDAYEVLKANLKSVRVRPGKMSDMLFRVNWKAKTKTIPERHYNRLSTWSAARITVHAGASPTDNIQVTNRDFAQFEFDINTPAERTAPLPLDKLGTIYTEFFQLAEALADVGEGP